MSQQAVTPCVPRRRAFPASAAFLLPCAGLAGGSASCGSQPEPETGPADGGGAVGDPGADAAPPDGVVAPRKPVDLVPYVRLAASATFIAPALPFPNEERDGIATIRDDFDGSGYRPPIGEPVTVELDALPWLSRPVRLASFEMEMVGAQPKDVRVLLSAGCGSGTTLELAWEDPARPLDLGGASAGCVALRLTAGEPLVLTRLSLLSGEEPPAPCRAGEPWSHQPFSGGGTVLLSGLPGAEIEGGVLHFTPPHAGRYEVVVAAVRAGEPFGWAARTFLLTCGPAL